MKPVEPVELIAIDFGSGWEFVGEGDDEILIQWSSGGIFSVENDTGAPEDAPVPET